jgi:hypothetical protein
MALPNRMSLRPGLLWLTLNLAVIIHYYHEIIHFSQFHIPHKMSSYPRLKATVLGFRVR